MKTGRRWSPSISAVFILLMIAAGIQAQTIERVSVDSDGMQGSGTSYYPCITPDGRYVGFGSSSPNLVASDTNSTFDTFLHDRQTGMTTRVSLNSAGVEGNDASYAPYTSDDGRYIAFNSNATNLVGGDTNGFTDIFVRDRQLGATTRVSVSSSGAQANGGNSGHSISSNGRYVAFVSFATNLVDSDTNGSHDVFVHDRQTGATTRVSVDSTGTQGNDLSTDPKISSDGHWVAFHSHATNLVENDTNWKPDVFVHDRQTGTTTMVSVDSAGVQGDDSSKYPSLSSDGRYIAFQSVATNLVADDTNGVKDIFVHDRITGVTTRVSVSTIGAQAGDDCAGHHISVDGQFVTFASLASTLVGDDTNGLHDIFLHDRGAGTTTRVSLGPAGVEADNNSYSAVVSSGGLHVALNSYASNLVPDDTNGQADIFVHSPNSIFSDGFEDGTTSAWSASVP